MRWNISTAVELQNANLIQLYLDPLKVVNEAMRGAGREEIAQLSRFSDLT